MKVEQLGGGRGSRRRVTGPSGKTYLVQAADSNMTALFDTLELRDATTTKPLNIVAVQRAADDYLADGRRILKVSVGKRRRGTE